MTILNPSATKNEQTFATLSHETGRRRRKTALFASFQAFFELLGSNQ
jgi:hypothetical protein